MLSSWIEFWAKSANLPEQLPLGSQFARLEQLHIDAVGCGMPVVLEAIREGVAGYRREQRRMLATKFDRCERQPGLRPISARRQCCRSEECGNRDGNR